MANDNITKQYQYEMISITQDIQIEKYEFQKISILKNIVNNNINTKNINTKKYICKKYHSELLKGYVLNCLDSLLGNKTWKQYLFRHIAFHETRNPNNGK